MNLERLFKPRSIAIVGASDNLDRIGGMPIKLLKRWEYTGKVFPINPKYEEIAGYKCYPSISAIGEEIDVALLAVSAGRVLPVLQECVDKKVKFVDIFGSGFTEAGNEAGQHALLDAIKGSETRILGPNNQGVVNFWDKSAAAFSPLLDRGVVIPCGNIAVISQSSGMGFAVLGQGAARGLGFSYIATLGNQADITAGELGRFMIEDEHTKVVAFMIEGIRPGDDLPGLVRRAREQEKEVVFFKLGRTEVGKKASASHSGSLAGDAEVFEAFCQQYGAILVHDYEELLDVFTALQTRPVRGRRVAVLTGMGGAGIMAADICHDLGLEIPPLSDETVAELRSFLPAFASVMNPIDYTAQAINDKDSILKSLSAISKDSTIDVLLPIFGLLSEASAEKYCNDIIEINKTCDKPVFVFSMSTEQPSFSRMRAEGVPLYFSAQRCLKALSNVVRPLDKLCCTKSCKAETQPAAEAEAAPIFSLTEFQVKQLLAASGVHIPAGGQATSLEEARNLAAKIGYPVVMKLMSPQITHKTNANVVLLNIKDQAALDEAYPKLYERGKAYAPAADLHGVLVEKMLPAPVGEMFVGVKIDPSFGPVMIFGMGGIFVEILRDIARLLLPASREDVMKMISSIKAFPLLNGYRGRPKADIEALADLICKVGDYAVKHQGEFKELEINPIFVLPEGQGVFAGDALVVPC